MFTYVLIRVLACVGLTMIPVTLFNLWFHEELRSWEKRPLEWFRVAGNVTIVSLMLAIILAFMA